MNEKELSVLKWAGAMGHEFIGVKGPGDEPSLACETNSIESAKRLCGSDLTLRVYRRSDRRKKAGWVCCFDARETKVQS